MNKIKKSLLIISVLCLILVVTACSEKDANKNVQNDENVIATVNGKPISKDEYNKALTYYKDNVESQYGEGTWEKEAKAGMTYKKYYEDYVMDTMTYRLCYWMRRKKKELPQQKTKYKQNWIISKYIFKMTKIIKNI